MVAGVMRIWRAFVGGFWAAWAAAIPTARKGSVLTVHIHAETTSAERDLDRLLAKITEIRSAASHWANALK